MSVQGEHKGTRGERQPLRAILIAVVAVVACRTGGPDAQGRSDGAAGTDDAAGLDSVLSRGQGARDASAAAPDTAAVLTGAAGSGGATGSPPADAATAPPEAGPAPTATGCMAPAPSEGCDPVCDTGCPALSRCDVTDQPRTGRCIGIWISGEGDLCLKTDVTDPCASHLTCVEGACRRLCYRDADCASPGTCCGQDLLLAGQPSGYKICVACPR